MKNRKYDNSKIFIICRSMIQVEKFMKAFNRGYYSGYIQSIMECGEMIPPAPSFEI